MIGLEPLAAIELVWNNRRKVKLHHSIGFPRGPSRPSETLVGKSRFAGKAEAFRPLQLLSPSELWISSPILLLDL